MNEKQIEKDIVRYLKTTLWLVETMNWWSVMIKKGWYNHRMTLNTKGCPDILFYLNKQLFWIEVKKNKKEVDKWLIIRDRYNWIWKTLEWLKSYEREKDQIRYSELLKDNGGIFILTCEVQEVIEYVNLIIKNNKNV